MTSPWHMNAVRIIVLVMGSTLFAIGCGTSSPTVGNLRKITLGMTRNTVAKALGEPTVARGAVRNKFQQVIEVWEYSLVRPNKDSPGESFGKASLTVLTLGMGAAIYRDEIQNYWLYFVDDKLAQWGAAGDWKKEPERIYEFNFNPQPTLTK